MAPPYYLGSIMDGALDAPWPGSQLLSGRWALNVAALSNVNVVDEMK